MLATCSRLQRHSAAAAAATSVSALGTARGGTCAHRVPVASPVAVTVTGAVAVAVTLTLTDPLTLGPGTIPDATVLGACALGAVPRTGRRHSMAIAPSTVPAARLQSGDYCGTTYGTALDSAFDTAFGAALDAAIGAGFGTAFDTALDDALDAALAAALGAALGTALGATNVLSASLNAAFAGAAACILLQGVHLYRDGSTALATTSLAPVGPGLSSVPRVTRSFMNLARSSCATTQWKWVAVLSPGPSSFMPLGCTFTHMHPTFL